MSVNAIATSTSRSRAELSDNVKREKVEEKLTRLEAQARRAMKRAGGNAAKETEIKEHFAKVRDHLVSFAHDRNAERTIPKSSSRKRLDVDA